jgi:hypothetical protein
VDATNALLRQLLHVVVKWLKLLPRAQSVKGKTSQQYDIGDFDVQIQVSWTSSSKLFAPGHFTPGTHFIGGWGGGLQRRIKEKNLDPTVLEFRNLAGSK